VEAVIYTIYGSQDAAILALKAGEIDMLLNPLGMQRGLLDQVENAPNLEVLRNPVNGFRYMAFNHRRQPMNDCSFRQAVTFLIDKDFVAKTILQNVAYPLYSYVPEANGAWYFDDVPKFGLRPDGTPMSREERITMAVQILENAGYSWENDQKPYWDVDAAEVRVGGRLIMPDGTPVPDLELWAPSAAYDPLRSTFAIWIESWLNEAGIPVKAHLANFNTLIPLIFTEHAFDMYILGWSLDVFPAELNDYFTSEQAVPDGNNAAGYTNPEFDELGKQLLTCDSQAVCKKITEEIQVMLSTEAPYVLLFDTGIIEPYNTVAEFPYTNHLSGLQYNHITGNSLSPLQTAVKIK
jgi:peptide/nickel transport system substrate-binding protein